MRESNLSLLVDRALAGESSTEARAEACRQLAACEDRVILRKAANGSQARVREAAIRRNIELEPMNADHYLELYRHFQALGLEDQATTTLDQAEAKVPDDVSIMRCRLALHAEDEAADLLTVAKAYLPRFGSDPFLGMVIYRCEMAGETAASAVSEYVETANPVILPRPDARESDQQVPSPQAEVPVTIPMGGAANTSRDTRIAHIMDAMRRPAATVDSRPKKRQPRRVVLPIEGPPPLDER